MNARLKRLFNFPETRRPGRGRRRAARPGFDALEDRITLSADLTGFWHGTLTQSSGGPQSAYDFVMDLVQSQGQSQVQGVSRIELADPAYFGTMSLTGSLSGSTFAFKEQAITINSYEDGYSWLEKSGQLTESADSNSLSGQWSSSGYSGTISLTRETITPSMVGGQWHGSLSANYGSSVGDSFLIQLSLDDEQGVVSGTEDIEQKGGPGYGAVMQVTGYVLGQELLLKDTLVTQETGPTNYRWPLKAINLAVSSDGSTASGPWSNGGEDDGAVSLVFDSTTLPTGGATITTMQVGPQSSVYGQTVTLTATVNPATGASGTPTGQITFNDGPLVLASVPISGGSASYTVSTLRAGTHSITATYSGDPNFGGSTSAAASLSVAPERTWVSLASSANPSGANVPVTLTATVSAISPGSGAPTGTVTFSTGSTSLGTVAVVGGVAALPTTSLPIGTDTLVAKFSGDANSLGSSTTLQQTVKSSEYATVTVLASSNPFPSAGQRVTLTANVNAIARVSGTAPGVVTFVSGTTTLGTAALRNGKAKLTTSALPFGQTPIVAIYGGSSNLEPSRSAALIETVGTSRTKTKLKSSPDRSRLGENVVFRSTVTTAGKGNGTASGSVTFWDGSISLGTVGLAGGKASLETNGLSPGTHHIEAVYNGNSGFAPSALALVKQTVKQSKAPAARISIAQSSPRKSDEL